MTKDMIKEKFERSKPQLRCGSNISAGFAMGVRKSEEIEKKLSGGDL